MKFSPFASTSALIGRARRQQYEQIPDDENEDRAENANVANREAEDAENRSLIHTKLWTLQIRKHQRIFTGVLTVIGFVIGAWVATLFFKKLPSASCDTVRHGYKCLPKISQYWGQYSPYYSVPSPISNELPPNCRLTFAQILSRHGARDPTLGKSLRYAELISRIHSKATSYSKKTKFIKDYQYELSSDQLTPFGQQQMKNSGEKFYERYQELARNTTPFVRAAGQARVIESALNWTQGFHNSKLQDEAAQGDPEEFPYGILIIPETRNSNNTLDYTLCTKFLSGPFGGEAQQKFGEVFIPPIAKRMNTNIPGSNLTFTDIISIMDLCPFQTVASVIGEISPFCNLFSEEEWKDYDYFQSLGKYYGFEWGNPMAPTQGVGWTNELIARLTGSPVDDHTCTNSTLDENPETFPLGGKSTLFADFSHDNDMTTMFAAMGLYNDTLPLANKTRWERGQEGMGSFAAAWTVPFAGRMYVEKMVCDVEEESGAGEELVRVVVNDRVLPLKTCGGDELGRCGVKQFVESLGFARRGGDWEKCFV